MVGLGWRSCGRSLRRPRGPRTCGYCQRTVSLGVAHSASPAAAQQARRAITRGQAANLGRRSERAFPSKFSYFRALGFRCPRFCRRLCVRLVTPLLDFLRLLRHMLDLARPLRKGGPDRFNRLSTLLLERDFRLNLPNRLNLSLDGRQSRMNVRRRGDRHPIATIGVGSIVAQHSEHVLKRRQPVRGSLVSNFTGLLARRPWFASGTLPLSAMTVGHIDKP